MKMEETIVVNKSERPDSLDIGSPSKGGAVKVYFDASKPDEAKILIDNAIKLRSYANTQI
jgi:hypothetical protein